MTPISFKFVAAGAATQAKGLLYRFKPAREGEAPDWNGRGGIITPHEVSSPITDKSYWEGRYALCELTLRKQDGQTLVINDAVCAVSRAKNIVTTQMVGMDGTVKEYINEGDCRSTVYSYDIDPHSYDVDPLEEGRTFKKQSLFACKQAVV